MIVTTTKAPNPINGIYISGEYIKSVICGESKFCSIIFSIPLPIETIKNSCGVSPTNVAQKKLFIPTLKMQGNTFDSAKGIPPMNL